MSFNLATSYQIIRKAGANANSAAIASGALLADFCDQAESQLCDDVDIDLINDYSSIADNLKPQIAKAVASLAAMDVIAYDPTGYLNSENQLILDVLNNNYEKTVNRIVNRQKKLSKFGAIN